MNNVYQILNMLNEKLDSKIELTLYGRAALQLGFDDSIEEHALTKDVDAVFQIGQAEMLLAQTNFWEAIEAVNQALSDQELYISHFFTEDQIVRTKNWLGNRIRIKRNWKNLLLYRLGDIDLLLSKLMRDDPIDRKDAIFIVKSANLKREQIITALQEAFVPDVPDIREQLEIASFKLLQRI